MGKIKLCNSQKQGRRDGEMDEKRRTEQEKGLNRDHLPTKGEGVSLDSLVDLDPGVPTIFQTGMMDPRPPLLPSCKLKGCNSSQGFW